MAQVEEVPGAISQGRTRAECARRPHATPAAGRSSDRVGLAELLDGRIAQLTGGNTRSGGFHLSAEASNRRLKPVAAPAPTRAAA
jgi:hypothetical protein